MTQTPKTPFKIGSNIRPINSGDNDQYFVTFFYSNSAGRIKTKNDDLYYYTATGRTNSELNQNIKAHFMSEYLLGTFDEYLSSLGFNKNQHEIFVSHNKFITQNDLMEIVATKPKNVTLEEILECAL